MKRLGKSTVCLNSAPHIIQTASIAGKKEGEGPLKQYFDYILKDEYWGEKSFEKTESKLAKENVNFSNTSQIGGAYTLYGTTWTVGAMAAQTAGVPCALK